MMTTAFSSTAGLIGIAIILILVYVVIKRRQTAHQFKIFNSRMTMSSLTTENESCLNTPPNIDECEVGQTPVIKSKSRSDE